MAVVQAALLGLTAVLLAAQLKPLKPEYAVYLVLAASIGVGFLGLARLGVLLDTLREIGNGIRIRHVYLAALFKMAGITYIAEFTSGICKDAGYSAVGTQVEMVGKLAILAVSAPCPVRYRSRCWKKRSCCQTGRSTSRRRWCCRWWRH